MKLLTSIRTWDAKFGKRFGISSVYAVGIAVYIIALSIRNKSFTFFLFSFGTLVVLWLLRGLLTAAYRKK